MPRQSPTGPEPTSRILILLGDVPLTNTVELALRHGPYACRAERTVAAARIALTDWQPHLLLVDIDIDGGAGMQFLDAPPMGLELGRIALTRRSDLRGKLEAFERGADDYIGLPFVPADLLARVRAVIRRTFGTTGGLIPRLRVGDLQIDMLNRTVVAGDHELHLTSLEQALLYLLAANAGTVLSRDQILNALWGSEYVNESNVVDRHVRSLRAKLQDDWRKPRYIVTVPGAGYRFVPTYADEVDSPA